jgi:hypothetical protein
MNVFVYVLGVTTPTAAKWITFGARSKLTLLLLIFGTDI